jgi:hypothetical protein
MSSIAKELVQAVEAISWRGGKRLQSACSVCGRIQGK